jgi:hypothetical protein
MDVWMWRFIKEIYHQQYIYMILGSVAISQRRDDEPMDGINCKLQKPPLNQSTETAGSPGELILRCILLRWRSSPKYHISLLGIGHGRLLAPSCHLYPRPGNNLDSFTLDSIISTCFNPPKRSL